MLTKLLQVETADFQGKQFSAVESLAAWYRVEQFRLQRERELFRGNLSGSELDSAMTQNATEQRLLNAGWANSSLRKHIDERAENNPGHIAGVEQRSLLQASSALPNRIAETSSRLTAKILYGYAARFNSLSEDIGWFREKIQPGAFAEAIKKSDIRFLFNHNADCIFGRTSAMTLELKEDSVGLNFTCYLLPFDPASYALARRIDRRDISACSFSFIVARDRWEFAKQPGDTDIRILEEIDTLFDVGPVTYPAYRQTSVQAVFEKLPARSDSQTTETTCDFEADSDEEIAREMLFYKDRDEKLADTLRERRRKTEVGYKHCLRILDRLSRKGVKV